MKNFSNLLNIVKFIVKEKLIFFQDV